MAPMAAGPEIGGTASATIVVGQNDLASALRFEEGDEFPPVFATSRMVALMEVAAARVLAPHLTPGELSVGVVIDVVHAIATPIGGTVTATARLTERDGKLFVFEVIASDDRGEVGRGTHKRAVVSAARLVAGASKRAALAP
jgi:fluoroacetyl-CoA thioesterase